MASAQSLQTFDIRNFVDRLTPAKGKNRYLCPVCEGDNLTFDMDKYEGYNCWNDDSDEHKAAIREALSPWAEVTANRTGNIAPTIQKSSPQPQKKGFKPIPLPQGGITLAKLSQPATDSPEPQQRNDRKRGKVLATQYHYSKTQWVERLQWDDPSKEKGYDKDFYPWHMGADNKPVCKKGEGRWSPYRWEEASAALQEPGVNALLVVEGEGCVEAYRSIGFAAVTFQGSAWSGADLKHTASEFKKHNAIVVIHPDHDSTGEQKAGKLQRACEEAGVPCLILNPLNLCSNLPKSGDVVNCLKAMSREEFIKRLEAEIHAAASEKQNQDAKQKQSQELQNDPFKASGMAAELAENYRDRLAWNDEGQSWYRYEADSPGVWSAESEISVGAVILAEIEARIGMEYTAHYLSEVLKLLKHRLLVRKWEEKEGLIPFKNGVMDWQTGELLPHSPGYRFTYSLPHDHNPLASDWNTISEWMDEATGGNNRIKNILLCWLNACLKGRSDLQRFLHLVGPGGTGKGTFMRLAIYLVGKHNQHSTSLQDWCGNRFETANAYKKRLLVFSDEDKYSGGLGNLKKVTGGDEIRGEVKNKTAFTYVYGGMVMLASNYPLFAGDTSSGIARRGLVVPFNHVVSPGKRRNLEEEFAPELSALTNYVLAIPDAVVTQTLRQSADQSPEVIETTWEYRMRLDSVTAWLNECVISDPLASERVGADKNDESSLFGSYYQYCDRTGSRAKGSREFSPALLDLVNNILHWGVEKKRVTSGFIIQGLRLRTPADLAQPYCIEALSNVGSSGHVGLDVGSDVESETLPEEGYVGYVGSDNSFEKIQNTNFGNQVEVCEQDFSQESSQPSYTPCTNQSEQQPEPYTSTLQVQDGDSTQLPADVLERAVDRMAAVDSVESFQEFYDRYQRCSKVQQQQVMDAFTIQVKDDLKQARFYELWEQFESLKAVTKDVQKPEPAQDSAKSVSAKWLIVNYQGNEQTVKFVSQKGDRLTVRVSGYGEKTITASQVIRISDYTGD
jgi:P4 family phage/plasmid primase-like protien